MHQLATTDDPAAFGRCTPRPTTILRRQPRLARRVPCRLEFRDDDSQPATALVGQTVHTWDGGLAIQISRNLELNRKVELQLPEHDGGIAILQGAVTYSRRVLSGTYEVGVRLS